MPKFRPKLVTSHNNPSLTTGVKLFNQHTAGQLNAHNADVKILFFDQFLNSFKDEKNEFSNFVDRLGIKNTSTYKNILSLSKNPQQIANEITAIDILHRQNSKRIKEILSHDISKEIINYFNDSIFESTVNKGTDFFDPNGKGKFRFFSIYAINPDNLNDNTQNLIVILIDPYHLVCPVANRQKNFNKDENRHYTFEKYKECRHSLSDLFKEKFDNSDSVRYIHLNAFASK